MKYCISELILNAVSLIYTSLFWPGARLVRFPTRIINRKLMKYGKGLTTGYRARIEMNGDNSKIQLTIGENCIIGDFVHIAAGHSVKIGNNVLMASRVFISDTSHGSYRGDENDSLPDSAPNERVLVFADVSIGNNVWIGENVCILPGTAIGSGCIIGANSVVKGNFPNSSVMVGIPARVIKTYCEQSQVWKRIKH